MEIIKNQYNSGNLVKQTRKLTKLKQEELAKIINRSRVSISRVEINQQEISLSKYLEILEKNGLSMIIYKEDN